MTHEEQIAKLTEMLEIQQKLHETAIDMLKPAIEIAVQKEREALEAELLKLKKGIASNSDYIQGRWDLIGEFQDVIRARGQA